MNVTRFVPSLGSLYPSVQGYESDDSRFHSACIKEGGGLSERRLPCHQDNLFASSTAIRVTTPVTNALPMKKARFTSETLSIFV